MKPWLNSSSVTLVDKFKPYIFALWAIAVIVYVNLKAPIIWKADWTHDDLMNCYRAMETPWRDMLGQVAMFWRPSSLFRPLGEMFYKAFWEQFGFSPLPWRIACGGLMIGNAFIIGHIARRLSGSFSVGLAATAIASFHTFWAHLYLNTGTIFEIAAFTLVYLGLAYYIEFRDPWLTCVILILGLNMKESAVILAPLVVIYEWIWHRRTPWIFCGLAAAICLSFIRGRIFGPEGLTSVGPYKPTYSLETYVRSFRGYFAPLIVWQKAPLWATLLIAISPLLLRNKLATFAVALFPIAILPLAFVPDRGLEGVYIACAALPLAVSAVLLLIPREEHRLLGAVALFALAAYYLPGLKDMQGWDKENREIRAFREGLVKQFPQLPPGVQIRFIHEPFTEDYPWASTFATRLVYKDPQIVVVSPNNPHTKDLAETADFASFDWRDNQLQRVK